MPVFSLARYSAGDHIGEHDDKAHVPVSLGGAEVLHSRKYAAILYLTREPWRSEFGGLFVDQPTGRRIFPAFNRCERSQAAQHLCGGIQRARVDADVPPNALARTRLRQGWWCSPFRVCTASRQSRRGRRRG